ncbi:carbohydrate kinase [Lutibacter sp.]|uniref:carbohydrate kinase family protein n=1 Tax=Lutibacter sp. TaxID=1925666 RepID=UPI00356B53D9
MTTKKLKAVCFGEILFDTFLKHKKIGGAPLNVASRLKSFGIDVSMISAVGNDENGKELLTYFKNLEIPINSIQVKENYPTGLVNVQLNEKGNASYDITYPSAWDKIRLSIEDTELVKDADFFVFGSLASRDESTKKTLSQLLNVANYKIFDVNLRVPHYTEEALKELMVAADFIKFNDDELFEVSKYLGSNHRSLEQNIKYISKETNTAAICVTLGSHGAVLYYKGTFYNNCGFKVDVLDTVGSGDSFLASLVTKLFNEVDPQDALNFACAVGAIVAQNEGANPIITPLEIEQFLKGF